MRRIALVLLLAGSTSLSGCLAAAVPVLVAGTYGGKKVFGKKDDDLPSSTTTAVVTTAPAPSPAAAPPPPGAPAAVAAAAPQPEPLPPPPPPPGTVPPGMQYLYGSGEASALSVQAYLDLTDFLVARGSDYAIGHPLNSVVLAPDATLANPKFVTCAPSQRPAVVLDIDETAILNLGYEAEDSQRTAPYDQDRWDRWEASGIKAVDAVPGVLDAIRAARASGIEIVYNSNRSVANEGATAAALTSLGLGPVTHLRNLWLKGDGGGTSGKDTRRWAISQKYCVIAMVGDQLGDFSDLFNASGLTVADRRAGVSSPKIRQLWGHGWFILPNPVYGTGLKGNVDDVFPKSRRWTDPGPGAAAPAPAPAAGAPAAPTVEAPPPDPMPVPLPIPTRPLPPPPAAPSATSTSYGPVLPPPAQPTVKK